MMIIIHLSFGAYFLYLAMNSNSENAKAESIHIAAEGADNVQN